MKTFLDYAYYYNAFYGDKDYKKEASQLKELLTQYGSNIHNIMDYGCGTGRHDVELCRLGYNCTGIDISETMVALAKENAAAQNMIIPYSVADIRNYRTSKKYDAVISMFHVMSYQNENDDALHAFESARKVLNRDGIFIFDAWYGPGVLSDKPTLRVKEIEDNINKLIRIARPIMHDAQNIVDVQYEILIINKNTSEVKRINEIHRMRYFFVPEIKYLLQECGFEFICNLDCATLKNTSFESWTSYFIAKAV